MKKFLCFILIAVLCLAVCSCNDNSSEKAMLKLHNTAETDIIKLTLDNAKFTIALDNTNGNNYGTIKEYDESKDVKNPFVAAKGHTLVAFSFTLENLDRQSIDLGGSFNGRFISLEYNDQIYGDAGQAHILASGNDKFNWDKYTYGNILIKPNETLMYRGYMDIPVEVGNLNDSFDLTFRLPNSKGATEDEPTSQSLDFWSNFWGSVQFQKSHYLFKYQYQYSPPKTPVRE